MLDQATFIDLIAGIRLGDHDAAAALFEHYEPIVRREIRLRILDRRLNRRLDTADLCQATLASFIIRAAAGEYELADVRDATRLVIVMVRHKIASAMRRERSGRRDMRREEVIGQDRLEAIAAAQPTPSQIVSLRELVERARSGLSLEESQLREMRARGCDWAEIARNLGGSPDARRVQLSRALNRVAEELGLGVEGSYD